MSLLMPRAATRCAENTWAVLKAAILEINNHNASGLSFEELYRWVQPLTSSTRS